MADTGENCTHLTTHKNIAQFCNNTPTVSWSIKLTASKSSTAGHLLRALALRQHIHRSSPLLATSIAGENNIMVDIASCSFQWSQFTKSNFKFITIFNDMFPLPHNYYWKESQIPKNWSSSVLQLIYVPWSDTWQCIDQLCLGLPTCSQAYQQQMSWFWGLFDLCHFCQNTPNV